MKTKKAQHTPGPWSYVAAIQNPIDDRMSFVYGLDPSTSDEAEALANARLIAAAPELLGVAKTMLNVMLGEISGLEDSDRSLEANVQRAHANMLCTAIAKAEGKE